MILYFPQRWTAAGKTDDCNVWHYASPSTAVQIIRPGIPDNYEHSYSRSSPGTQNTFFFSDRKMESSTKGLTKYLNILLGPAAFSAASLRGPYTCQYIHRNFSCKSDCTFTSSYCHNIIIHQGLCPAICWWDMAHLVSSQLGYYFVFICPYVYVAWMQDRLKVIDIFAAAWSLTLRGGAKILTIFQILCQTFRI